jgi:hypothetical protein
MGSSQTGPTVYSDLPNDVFPCFLTKILYEFLSSPKRATRSAHLILLDLITPKILGEE